jgi:hypothetical protein
MLRTPMRKILLEHFTFKSYDYQPLQTVTTKPEKFVARFSLTFFHSRALTEYL